MICELFSLCYVNYFKEVKEVHQEVKEVYKKYEKISYEDSVGCLVIRGKGLPPPTNKRSKEGPFKLLANLIWRMLQVKEEVKEVCGKFSNIFFVNISRNI